MVYALEEFKDLHDEDRSLLAESLWDLGLYSMSDRYRYCHNQFLLLMNWDTDQCKIVRMSCDVKGCPICKYRKSNHLFGQLLPIIQEHKRKITELVLTKKRIPEINKEEIDLFRDQINEFLNHYKKQIKGSIISFEHLPKEDGYHLHAHLILIADYLYQPILTWNQILGYEANLFIKGFNRAKESTIKKILAYITRYAIKNVIKEANPKRRAMIIKLLYHKRMIRTRGLFRTKRNAYESQGFQFAELFYDLGSVIDAVVFIYGNISSKILVNWHDFFKTKEEGIT